MKNEEELKKKRADLLYNLVNKIKDTILLNNVKGEQPSKTFIYTRIADYTYYSEVSIRKFISGYIPKDISAFIEGIVKYLRYIGIEEEYIEEFTKEYVSASNAVVIDVNNSLNTKNNIIPQDLTTIVRPRKLVEFIQTYVKGDINIAFIYGHTLSGKTKSVMGCVSDFIYRNIFENIVWVDILEKETQQNKIINTILQFCTDSKQDFDEIMADKYCQDYLAMHRSLLVIDFEQTKIENDTIAFLKELARKTKIIIISNIPFKEYEEELQYYSSSFCTNDFIGKIELEQILKLNTKSEEIINKFPEFIDKLYNITGGFPFASIHIMKRIIEDNKYGISFEESIKRFSNDNIQEYSELATKIISDVWEKLDNLSKNILIICSKFNCSVSLKLISNICDKEISNYEWRRSMEECYYYDLLSPIILNNPRVNMNIMIRTLIKSYEDEIGFDNQQFMQKLSKYYVDLTANVGECYNNLDKFRVLDDVDEWSIIKQSLNMMEEKQMYNECLTIYQNCKYYRYVRGMWEIGDSTVYVRRAEIAHNINDVNAELEAICDYINVCSKSKNSKIAEENIERAKKIIETNKKKIEPRLLCLYNHVKALYIYNCKENYEASYDIWKFNKANYSNDVSKYRNLVNDLWLTRCYVKIEKDYNKKYEELKYRIAEMQEEGFIRAEIDLILILIGMQLEQYIEVNEENKEILLESINEGLSKCSILLEKKSNKDIRNQAQYYKYMAIVYGISKNEELKNVYLERATDNYKLMNCNKDIENLKDFLGTL